MENKLKTLAQWLQKVTSSDFDCGYYGKLESIIAESQAEVCNKIGGYLEEILEMDDKQLKENLND